MIPGVLAVTQGRGVPRALLAEGTSTSDLRRLIRESEVLVYAIGIDALSNRGAQPTRRPWLVVLKALGASTAAVVRDSVGLNSRGRERNVAGCAVPLSDVDVVTLPGADGRPKGPRYGTLVRTQGHARSGRYDVSPRAPSSIG